MDNPLDQPRNHEDIQQDIEDFARDLAFGAQNGDWTAVIHVPSNNEWGFDWIRSSGDISDNRRKFREKWIEPQGRAPSYQILASLGYLNIIETVRYDQKEHKYSFVDYLLTEKAHDLLKKPASPKSIFVSYRRKESSAFALLVEARLRHAGADPDRIFIDKNMPGGELWERRIREEIRHCDYFVCLIAPETLDPIGWVRQEIEWVNNENPDCLIIPFCHNGARLKDAEVQSLVGASNGGEIGKNADEETGLDYEAAVNFILNAIGYHTY